MANEAGVTVPTNWVVDAGEIIGPCGCRYPNDEEGHKAATEHEHPEQFLLVIDCEADLREFYPLERVVEAVKQALTPMNGVEVKRLHASIREAREEILHAVEAVHDEEERRRG